MRLSKTNYLSSILIVSTFFFISCNRSLSAYEKHTISTDENFLNYKCCRYIEQDYLAHVCSVLKLHEAIFSMVDLEVFGDLKKDLVEVLSFSVNEFGKIERCYFKKIRTRSHSETLIQFANTLTAKLKGELVSTKEVNANQTINLPFKIISSAFNCLEIPQVNYGAECELFLDEVKHNVFLNGKLLAAKQALVAEPKGIPVKININDYMWDCYEEYEPLTIYLGSREVIGNSEIKRQYK